MPPGLEFDKRKRLQGHGRGEYHFDPQSITPIAALSDKLFLHSIPGATQILFIDFDGQRGGYKPFSIDADSGTFSDTERLVIQ